MGNNNNESGQPNQTYSSNGPMLQGNGIAAPNDSLDAIDLNEIEGNNGGNVGAAPLRNGGLAIQSLVQNNADRRNN